MTSSCALATLGVLYALLSAGALTTLYPFLVMVTSGFKGQIDQNDNRLIPAYWSDESELYRKYIDDKYAGDQTSIAATRGGSSSTQDVQKYREFILALPPDFYVAAFRQPPGGLVSRLNSTYRAWLRKRFSSIEQLNRVYLEEATSFENVLPPLESFSRIGLEADAGAKVGRLVGLQGSATRRIQITDYRSGSLPNVHSIKISILFFRSPELGQGFC